MEDFKDRLVEEYKQLSNRITKLGEALNKDDFYNKVGRVQHFYMVSQYTGMRIYKEALEDRLEDLGIKVD